MNHQPLRCAVAVTALSAAFATWAQDSTVQISGRLGSAATYFNHQTGRGSLKTLGDSLLAGSYLRFGGREDLGGGLAAVFRLESGVALDTGGAGSSTKFWNRQSWVGLQLGKAGVVTLGRQFHTGTDLAIESFDVYQLAGSGSHMVPLALIASNRYSANDTRVDNSIKYRVAVPEILDFGASVGAGEGVIGKSYSADISHHGSNYELGAYYMQFDAPTRIASTGALPREKIWAVGGNLKLGSVRPYLAYYDISLDSTVAGRPAQKNKLTHVGVHWSAASQVSLKLAYYDDKGTSLNGIAGRNGKKQTVIASAEYLLSKRTNLYVAAFQNRFTNGYKLETLNITALNRDPNASLVTGYSAGITHRF